MATSTCELDSLNDMNEMFRGCTKMKCRLNLKTAVKNYKDCFLDAATASDAKITVYYAYDCTEDIATKIAATKSEESVVIVGAEYEQATITLNPNGGEIFEDTLTVNVGEPIGSLTAEVYYLGYEFLGWYTGQSDGDLVTATSTVLEDTTLYAHWKAVVVAGVKNLKVTSKSKKCLKITYSAPSTGAEGYQIQYSKSSKMAKGVKKVNVTTKSVTIKNLSSKKTYYVRVRAYKLDSTGAKVYGEWSSVKKIKIK